jgi:ribosomal protein S21
MHGKVMPQVIVMRDDMESAIRVFKSQVERDGILREVRFRLKTDPKPSIRRRMKVRVALKRKKRAFKRNQGECLYRDSEWP